MLDLMPAPGLIFNEWDKHGTCSGLSQSGYFEQIRKARADFDFSFVVQQRGMFSYSGLSKEQVEKLRTGHSIYAIDSGRICIAALNSKNVKTVAEAIANILV